MSIPQVPIEQSLAALQPNNVKKRFRPVTHCDEFLGFRVHVLWFLGIRVFPCRKKSIKKLNENCSFKKSLFYTRKKKYENILP